MATAKDLMNSSVRGVHESAALREAIALLAHHNLSGLPVIDSSGALKGMVTQYDTMPVFASPDAMDDPVTKHMTSESITVEQNAPVEEVAQIFLDKRIQRTPVVDGRTVVGVVSRADLVNYLAQFV